MQLNEIMHMVDLMGQITDHCNNLQWKMKRSSDFRWIGYVAKIANI